MTTIVLILLGFAIICCYEIPKLIERKYWKELVIFSVFLMIALVFTIMHGMGITLPNPNQPAELLLHFTAG